MLDRVDPLKLLVRLDIGRALLIALLAVGLGVSLPVWIIYPIVGLVSSLTVLYMPTVRMLIARIESESTLPIANSNLQMLLGVAGLVGFGLAGPAYAAAGLLLTLLADAITFVVAATFIMRSRTAFTETSLPVQTEPRPSRYLSDVMEGIRETWIHPLSRYLVLVSLGATLLLAPVDILSPALVRDVLRGPIIFLSLIEICVAGGRIIGSFASRRLQPSIPFKWLSLILGVMAIASLIVAGAPTLSTVMIAYLFLGGGAGASAVIVVTALQLGVESHLHGRIFSLLQASMEALPPISLLAVSVLADARGPIAAFVSIAIGLGLLAVGSAYLHQSKLRNAFEAKGGSA